MALYNVNSGSSGSSGQWEDITSTITLNPAISFVSDSTKFLRNGKTVKFDIRGTFSSSVTASQNMATGLNVRQTTQFALFSTDWANPSIIAIANCNQINSAMQVGGQPNIANKSFVASGIYIEN